ncbi:MAG: cysteine--tRNA ligase [Candidatus Marsarchaeota archaeon]|nr:cysteine--tRNA ligase [Candidatus Marsarchaeota archaeon]
MAFQLFNSASRKKEVFRPLGGKTVKIYVCGITPYDTTHLGHAFTYVSFDVLIRYLGFMGFRVIYTQNVTDIDDDILRKAGEEGTGWEKLGDRWTRRYLADMKSLNMLKPDHYVKATDSIPMIIRIVDSLRKKGFAYENGGNVYFDVSLFKGYGKLSNFNHRQMMLLLKERGGNPDDPNKRNPLDFVLWQGWKKGEPYWETPWGRGRPGWHIECSAMIRQYLGEQIDIHGGGRDLIFPHHESEIAQSESFTGKAPFAKYFAHTGMVMHMGEKMAKSLGNLILISDLLKEYSPNAIRWMLLSHHYRRVWEFDRDELAEAEKIAGGACRSAKASGNGRIRKPLLQEFAALMDDDLDTPNALELIEEAAENKENGRTVRLMMKTMGFIL